MKNIKYAISLFLALVMCVNTTFIAFASDAFSVSFVNNNSTVDVYYTQNLTGTGEKNVTVANPRSSATGDIDLSGDGQVNFVVNVNENYNFVDLEIIEGAKNYKNLKVISSDDENRVYSYRLTKITGDVTIRINTELALDKMSTGQLKHKINSRAGEIPRNYHSFGSDNSVKKIDDLLVLIDNLESVELSNNELINLYIILDEAIDNFEYKSGTIPQVYINTNNNNGLSLTKSKGYVDTNIVIVDNDCVINENGQIKVRGNTTAFAPKKPYAIKFDTKQDVFGMGAAKKWVLLANCFDPTMVRNEICFNLARKMNLPYTPDSKYVELYMDGTLLGMYQLTEAVEDDKERVNIDTDNGDFLIELEREKTEAGETYVTSLLGNRFVIKSPENPTLEQQQYIKARLDEVDSAIKSKDFSLLEQQMDIDSFVKIYLINEYSRNNDYGTTSVNFYYKQGKFYAGPAWDFDRTFGYVEKSTYNTMSSVYMHYSRSLMEYPQYQQRVIDLLKQYHDDIESLYVDGGLVDRLCEENAEAIARNYNEAGWDVSYPYLNTMSPLPTYEENINVLKVWMRSRHEYLQTIYNDDFLPIPTTLSAKADDDSITVTWTETEGADSYRILRGTKIGSWTAIASKVYGTSYTDYTAEPDVKYYYKVVARYGSKASKNFGDGEGAMIHLHQYNELIKPSDCSDYGYKSYRCDCGSSYKEMLAPIGHKLDSVSTNNIVTYRCIECDYSTAMDYDTLFNLWSVEYINSSPNRTVDNSAYLDVVSDGIINAKDYALIRNMQ